VAASFSAEGNLKRPQKGKTGERGKIGVRPYMVSWPLKKVGEGKEKKTSEKNRGGDGILLDGLSQTYS